MPLSVSETVSIIGMLISTISLVYVILRFRADSSTRDANRVAEQTEQRIRQEAMSEQLGEILKQVNQISAKLSDHTVAITQLNERMSTIFRRVERVEGVLDLRLHDDIGGTD